MYHAAILDFRIAKSRLPRTIVEGATRRAANTHAVRNSSVTDHMRSAHMAVGAIAGNPCSMAAAAARTDALPSAESATKASTSRKALEASGGQSGAAASLL